MGRAAHLDLPPFHDIAEVTELQGNVGVLLNQAYRRIDRLVDGVNGFEDLLDETWRNAQGKVRRAS